MNIEDCAFDHAHPLGEPATHPIARLASRLAALHPQGVRRIRKAAQPPTTPLLRLAGNDHARRRALPDDSPDAHSGVFN